MCDLCYKLTQNYVYEQLNWRWNFIHKTKSLDLIINITKDGYTCLIPKENGRDQERWIRMMFLGHRAVAWSLPKHLSWTKRLEQCL